MIITNKFELERWINQNGILFFKPEEFVCKHCGKVVIDTKLIEKLELLRFLLNKPIIITSAYRCPEYNKQVGGVKNSAHTKGKAVDISVKSSNQRYHILKTLFENKIDFTRIGIHKSFIHLDIDEEKPQEVIWLYG